jgi:hypothetical protein
MYFARKLSAKGGGQIAKDFLNVNTAINAKKMIKNKYFLFTML